MMWPLLAGLLTACALLLSLPDARGGRGLRRLRSLGGTLEVPAGERKRRPSDIGEIGIDVMIATICASLKSGRTMGDALADAAGTRCGEVRREVGFGDAIGLRSLERVVRSRSRDDELPSARRVAVGLWCAIRLSCRLGCSAVECMQAVACRYRQDARLRHLRDRVRAVPYATARLLGALPVVTVALGYVLGADPLSFLLGSAAGLLCFAVGLTLYVVGLRWMLSLVRDLSMSP